MSFRARLTLFFALIVIIPMIAVIVVQFRLVADNAQGKADARVAEGLRAAAGLYGQARRDADSGLVRVARDRLLFRQLRAGRSSAALHRARALRGRERLARLAVVRRGSPVIAIGPSAVLARAARRLLDSHGRRFGRLVVAATTASAYARHVRSTTGLPVVVRRAGAVVASTLDKPPPAAALPSGGEVAPIELRGHDYRAATFEASGVRGGRVAVTVLSDGATARSSLSKSSFVVIGLLVGFLVLAVGFAFAVSRSLSGQVGRLLQAVRRMSGGELGTEVPVEGRDEFAALGQEFNTMSKQLAARLEDLRQERARLEDALLRVGEAFGSNLARDPLLEIVTRTAVEAVHAECGRASACDVPGEPLSERATVGDVEPASAVIAAAEEEALQHARDAEAALEGAHALAFPLRDRDGAPDSNADPGTPDPSGVLGIISVARAGEPFSPRERELFRYLAGQASISLENVELHQAARRQAVTDELTGLFNHRRFQEVVTREVALARRFGHEISLVMIDLDDFKAVNDSHGHQQGDLVLREVARILEDSSREIDEPARYGGEELALALPQTDLGGAYRLAERVRRRIAALDIPLLSGTGTMRVTASFGVAALPSNASDRDGLIAAADAALYAAKRAGKNRTERAG